MYKENAEAGERKDRERRDGEEGKGKAMRREREEESEEAAEEAGDREEAEIQAWYNRHRNLLARLRARHPEAFAEYLCVSCRDPDSSLYVNRAPLLMRHCMCTDNYHSFPCPLR